MDSLCGWHESSTRAASQRGVAAGCGPARTHRRRACLHLPCSRHTGPVSWSRLRGVFGILLEQDEDQFTITAHVLMLLQADSNCHLESKKGENILPSSTKAHAITAKMIRCTSYVNSWPQSSTLQLWLGVIPLSKWKKPNVIDFILTFNYTLTQQPSAGASPPPQKEPGQDQAS